MNTHLIPPSQDPAALMRWARQAQPHSPWLHEEVARRMQERLDVIRVPPQAWVDWEAWRGGLQAHIALRARYPHARVWQVVAHPQEALWLRQQTQAPRWREILAWHKPRMQQQGVPPAQTVQMVWANMLLHHATDPLALMQQWQQTLSVDGFLMFSCLGPDSLRELRAVHEHMGWPAPAQQFTDMHDWGDLLVRAGFAEPVMDMERITLTFATPERLLSELRELGRNASVHRWAHLRGRGWQQAWLRAVGQLCERTPEGHLRLTFEVVYGHAYKPLPRAKIQAESQIDLAHMRQMLARPGGRLA